MTLAEEQLKELDTLQSTGGDRNLTRCRAAADFIQKGQYEAAREALGDLWAGVGQRPPVGDLSPAVAAEVLLQCGALTAGLGSVRNAAGSQEQAKDLLSEAARKFRSQGMLSKVSEAQYELGVCYWRLGAHDEARVTMQEALKLLTDADVELKAKIHIRRTLAEVWDNRYYEALNILKEAEPVFKSGNDALKGRWHGQMALVLIRLALVEGKTEYADRAIIEFEAAIYHYEQAGHERHCALNLNNLAMTLHKLGRYREADRVIAGVVKTFEASGKFALLADALTVQGVVWARLGAFDGSVHILRRALDVAQQSGAHTQAGQAALTLIEEHGAARRLSESELSRAYQRADELLKDTQDAEDIKRLRACAALVIRRLSGTQPDDNGFSFQVAVHALEARLIEEALELEGGSITRAAKRLGLKRQTLSQMLTMRHKHLFGKRTPPERRLKSIIKKGA